MGRGGLKLAHALDAFGIAVAGREALDIGASTGGFTDVLLQRGATRVVALDVGHGQLDWRLRNDPRVVVHRGRQRPLPARPRDLPGPVDIVTIDVSFISLRHDPAAGAARCSRRAPTSWRWSSRSSRRGASEVGKKGVVRDPPCTSA